jgi:hypothetical protein
MATLQMRKVKNSQFTPAQAKAEQYCKYPPGRTHKRRPLPIMIW